MHALISNRTRVFVQIPANNHSDRSCRYGFGFGMHSASPGEKILIIKTAWGGKTIAEDFRPPSSVADPHGKGQWDTGPNVVGHYYRRRGKHGTASESTWSPRYGTGRTERGGGEVASRAGLERPTRIRRLSRFCATWLVAAGTSFLI